MCFAPSHPIGKKRARVANQCTALFGGKPYLFSQCFLLRIITQFILHNMQGSDEGSEVIIAGTLKGLAEEVGLPLSNAKLTLGCPSRRTLARSERRPAADVMVSVVQDMLHDDVQCLSLMVGKRSGIESVVKILTWTAKDENNRQMLKYFCLDVDQSNHSSAYYSEAIKMLIKKLHVAGLPMRVQFHAITGDSGGGGAVQNIHPTLIANNAIAGIPAMF